MHNEMHKALKIKVFSFNLLLKAYIKKLTLNIKSYSCENVALVILSQIAGARCVMHHFMPHGLYFLSIAINGLSDRYLEQFTSMMKG
jgi:hypothetical protein